MKAKCPTCGSPEKKAIEGANMTLMGVPFGEPDRINTVSQRHRCLACQCEFTVKQRNGMEWAE